MPSLKDRILLKIFPTSTDIVCIRHKNGTEEYISREEYQKRLTTQNTTQQQ